MRGAEVRPTTLSAPMPIYEYRCANGHTFEVIQSMSDEPVESCEECGAPVERVFHAVAVHFKGSGFYITDYRSESYKQGASSETKAASGASEGGSTGGGDAKPAAPVKESKPAAKSAEKGKSKAKGTE